MPKSAAPPSVAFDPALGMGAGMAHDHAMDMMYGPSTMVPAMAQDMAAADAATLSAHYGMDPGAAGFVPSTVMPMHDMMAAMDPAKACNRSILAEEY